MGKVVDLERYRREAGITYRKYVRRATGPTISLADILRVRELMDEADRCEAFESMTFGDLVSSPVNRLVIDEFFRGG